MKWTCAFNYFTFQLHPDGFEIEVLILIRGMFELTSLYFVTSNRKLINTLVQF